ncbi:MAG: 50S ribosomal protein L24 [Actinomycetota bacterium]|nr:50S ribosomal protein L24 [Actinomycetota bacterium]
MAGGLKIRKGDTVQVLAGKDKGKQGRVVNVYPDVRKVMVEGVNQVKRHEPVRPAPSGSGMIGGITTKEMPVHVSNVAIICDACHRPTRIGYKIDGDSKQRVCRHDDCGAVIS